MNQATPFASPLACLIDSKVDDSQDAADSIKPSIRLELDISDPESAASLVSHPAGRQRDEFARQALRIGVLALRQAQGTVDGDKLRNEGERLIADLASRLANFQEASEQKLASTLRHYFDPNDGRFAERVERLVRQDGELKRVMREQVVRAQQALHDTLGNHIGEQSPLLRLLSPGDDNLFIQRVKERIEQAVQDRSDTMLKEFSLDNPSGALARLLRELGERHGQLTQNLSQRIDTVIEEFSLDSEDSALSRLVKQVESTQKSLSAEFSLDAEDSALARLRREMLEVLRSQDSANGSFREEVLRALASMKIRKEEAARSTVHGREFERVGYGVIEKLCLKAGDVTEFVGNSAGALGRSKVGDCVVTLSADSAAAGARIVLEFKEDQTYTIRACLDELEQARKNRLAETGIFVFSKRSAAANLAPIQRFGLDIVVVWDAEEEASDIVLFAALSIAKALSTRARASDALPVDVDEMEAAIHQIEKQVGHLKEIRVKATTIRSGAESIIELADRIESEIRKRLDLLDECVGQLKTLESSGGE